LTFSIVREKETLRNFGVASPSSLAFDARGLDDWSPLLDFAAQVRRERLAEARFRIS
jgi:hypothetical protein